MIPYDAEKLLLFLEEEEFIVNKVKKMLYSQKVAPYVFVIPFVISLVLPLIVYAQNQVALTVDH